MFLLLIPLIFGVIVGVSNGLTMLFIGNTMLFIGNLHAVNPDLVPALGYGETFSLMLPLYALSLVSIIFLRD